LEDVENGEGVRILRNGRGIADIQPVLEEKRLSWKGVHPKLSLKGISLSKAILRDRK
jgi:antitoxin (DNA-binding transcriptional repressor) of toxin-antitoxin stability system